MNRRLVNEHTLECFRSFVEKISNLKPLEDTSAPAALGFLMPDSIYNINTRITKLLSYTLNDFYEDKAPFVRYLFL